MIIQKDLQFYIDKLKNGEKFSLARYGDGELYCMWGRQGRNSNGCYYYPALKQALLDSMKHENDPSFIYGLQRVLPHDEKRIISHYPNIKWHDTEVFSIAVAEGKLYPLIEALRKSPFPLVFIGNSTIEEFVTKKIGGNFIKVNKSNAFDERDYVIDNIKRYVKCLKLPPIFLFSCGMAANAFIGELHGTINATLIDVGHIWDPFAGIMSRCDLEGKTLEDIEKNLHAPTN